MWGARAAVAERAVVARHVRRLWGLPGTRLGAVGWPQSTSNRLHGGWNYWWQAHLLDCLVDAQERHPHPRRADMISRLVRGIHLRNTGSWTNDFYDDVAWLGLALMRANDVERISITPALTKIAAQLRSGWTDHGGGGIWWRRKDNFKNAPSNGPAAILFARWATRGGERSDKQRARSMTEWMAQVLVDPATGLLWDGVYVEPDGAIEKIVKITYTYCQGVYIGACVELAEGDTSGVWVARAERTINAVAAHLSDDNVVRGQGGGDGGLFAGILARYLAQAALRLSSPAAAVAHQLVMGSAEAAWKNRALARSGPLFGPEWSQPARVPRSWAHRRVERDLSVQLSGWMVLEAAALLERSSG
ncbi:glycoside hydrolase family 76 protein [Actinophytocola sp.]|uniref:glycoside hydrolase family 76 protein n=1 Tax=Actinophytocola sp. TaxID=1872138 RepID=UPI002ED40298